MEEIIRERAAQAACMLEESADKARGARYILNDLGFDITEDNVNSIIRDTEKTIEFLQEVYNDE